MCIKRYVHTDVTKTEKTEAIKKKNIKNSVADTAIPKENSPPLENSNTKKYEINAGTSATNNPATKINNTAILQTKSVSPTSIDTSQCSTRRIHADRTD